MHIKKFTQFIVENEHYGSINEGDVIPGVPYNSTGSGKAGSMSVIAKPEGTEIRFLKSTGADDKARINVSLCFPPSKKPTSIYDGQISAYAYVLVAKSEPGDNTLSYPAAATKMEDFDADKSAKPLFRGADSIDLLTQFMVSSGIAGNADAGTKLAQVIATLLLNDEYNEKVTDTFIKFANNISKQITIGGFILKMSNDEFVSDKQRPGVKALVAQFPKTRAALSPKKA
jgi:hypothetical protein